MLVVYVSTRLLISYSPKRNDGKTKEAWRYCASKSTTYGHEKRTVIEYKAIAAGYTLAISFGSPDDPNSAKRGVLMLTADDTVTMKRGGTTSPGIIKKNRSNVLSFNCRFTPAAMAAMLVCLDMVAGDCG